MSWFVRKKGWKIVLVLITFVVVFGGTYILNDHYIKKNVQTVQVAKISKKVLPYSLLTKEQVTMTLMPEAAVPEDAVFDLEEFFQEKQYYTGELGFGVGDLLSPRKLLPDNDAPLGKLVRLVDEQTMLIAINTNLVQSCANLVLPGTLVHALVYIKGKGMGEEDQVISFLENPDLANLLVVDKKNANSVGIEEGGREAIPAVVVFQIGQNRPNVAKTLVEYNEKGVIYLMPVGFQGDVFQDSVLPK